MHLGFDRILLEENQEGIGKFVQEKKKFVNLLCLSESL